MRVISRQYAAASKWSFLIGVSCVLSACFTGVGGLHKPTKYDGIWRVSITSPECINFESEFQVLGGGFHIKTRDLPAIFRKKLGLIGGVIRDGRIHTPGRDPIRPGADIITSSSELPVAEVAMQFPNPRSGSGTFRTSECSGTIIARYVRRRL